MKCKSWSNKINNFVVRRLKSIKINGTQQQQLQQQQSITTAAGTPTTQATIAAAAIVATATSSSSSSSSTLMTEDISIQQQHEQQQQQQQSEQLLQQQQQYQTMPAMPKEKAATAVSALNETNFAELNLKRMAVVTAMATTATSMTVGSRLQPHQQQSTCGCGAASAMTSATSATSLDSNMSSISGLSNNSTSNNMNIKNNNNNNSGSGSGSGGSSCSSSSGSGSNNSGRNVCSSSRYMTSGNSSPLAAAVASASATKRQWFRDRYQNGQQNTTVESTAATTAAPSSSSSTTAVTATTETATEADSNATGAAAATAAAPVTPPRRSPNDFIFGRYIGEGSFSMVYMAMDIHTRKEYAIKVCEKRHILREHKQDYVRREREVMHAMTNVPGFVNLSCTFQDARSLYFVMTLAKKGDMLPYINKVGSFDVDCTRHYAAELLLACEQMHRRNIVHRDLKPENILFDEDMHTLIADFGSSKIMTAKERTQAALRLAARSSDEDESEEHDEDEDDVDDVEVDDEEQSDEDAVDTAGSDEVDSPRRRYEQPSRLPSHTRHAGSRSRQQPRCHRKRKGSFVGTAQYVSPEVLQNGPITPAADLWALGCIVYQMISGLPPFRGGNDYVIFKDILACKPDFPEGFDKDAEELVTSLLKINPQERLGAQDEFGCYKSIRAHPFFAGIDWATVRQSTPPTISPYLPGVCKEEELRSNYQVPEDFQPGLNDRQISRLLGLELGVASAEDDDDDVASNDSGSGSGGGGVSTKTQWEAAASVGGPILKNLDYNMCAATKAKILEQQKSDKWHAFADGEVILKKGFVNKRKGLFARKRMLLLTTGPRLIYIDPMHMIKKGEIPWSPELRVEAKNFKIFFVHTPNRTYYLDDPEGYSLDWVESIEKMRTLTYANKKQPQQQQQTPAPLNTSPTTTKRTTSQSSLLSTSPATKSSSTAATSTLASTSASSTAAAASSSSVRNVTGNFATPTSTSTSAAAF